MKEREREEKEGGRGERGREEERKEEARDRGKEGKREILKGERWGEEDNKKKDSGS